MVNGFFSQEMDLREEDEVALKGFEKRLFAELNPEGTLETILTDRIITAFWRLRRLTKVEAGLIHYRPMNFFVQKSRVAADLSLYETAVEKGLYEALRELKSLQAVRLGTSQSRQGVRTRTADLTSAGVDLDGLIENLERDLIEQALTMSEGVKQNAAKLLGISFRSFRYRLEKLGWSID